MKPPAFAYESPETLDSAVAVLADAGDEAKPLAGGQSLIPLLNLRFASPTTLVDLNRLTGLDHIRVDGDTLRIGALTRHSTVEHSRDVAVHHPLLAQAMRFVAHPQVRNRGTLGGTIAHADPAAEIPLVMLLADARFTARSRRGERELAARDFFVSLYTTVLEPDEILTEVSLPIAPPRHDRARGSSFQEFARRHGDYAIGGAAAVVELDPDGVCTDVRIGLLGAGGTPLEAGDQARAHLLGSQVTPEAVRAAAHEATTGISPPATLHGDTGYRTTVITEMAMRALRGATDAAKEARA
ncbi:FAD binding domain-containing protein [Streptomyces sp. BH055]|uniref:FAD binding domain-containing protein n=1 Tax=Streptomyces sp. BH055 TaxID=3401173 RepID=UPI003BB6FDFE